MTCIQRVILFSSILALIFIVPLVGWAEDKIVITMTGSSVGQEGDLIREGAELYMKAHSNVDIQIFDVPDSTTAPLHSVPQKNLPHNPLISIFIRLM